MTEHKIARGQASAIAAMRHLSAGRLGLAALGVAVLLTIFSLVVVESGQVGVVLRTGTGSPHRVIDQPGVYTRIPFLERVWLIDTRWQTVEQTTLQSYVAQDQQVMQLAGWVVWRVNAPQRFDAATASGKNGIEERILTAMGQALSPIVAAQSGAVVAAGLTPELQSAWLNALNTQLEPMGVEAAQVGLRQVVSSDAASEAIYQRMASMRVLPAQKMVQAITADKRQLTAIQSQQRDAVLKSAYGQAQQQRQAADSRLANAYARQYGQALPSVPMPNPSTP